jgi:hypothetical protein
MLSDLHSFKLKFCSKEHNKNFLKYLIVAPQLSSGWQHNYSTKTRLAGRANEQSMYFSYVYGFVSKMFITLEELQGQTLLQQ